MRYFPPSSAMRRTRRQITRDRRVLMACLVTTGAFVAGSLIDTWPVAGGLGGLVMLALGLVWATVD